MLYRRLDTHGDMLPATKANPHFKDAEAVGAAIRSRLLSFYGEWWENTDDGIPIEMMFGKMDSNTAVIAEALIRSRVEETEGVQEIIDLRMDDDKPSRKRTITLTVKTVFGDTITVEV